jgi:FixJ family two-component response regulator
VRHGGFQDDESRENQQSTFPCSSGEVFTEESFFMSNVAMPDVCGSRIIATHASTEFPYMEVIRHLRRERLDIPTIIVSAPAYPNKYRDYIAAINLGAIDFLCYPYQQSDFERILDSAIAAHSRSTHPRVSESEYDLDERGAA